MSICGSVRLNTIYYPFGLFLFFFILLANPIHGSLRPLPREANQLIPQLTVFVFFSGRQEVEQIMRFLFRKICIVYQQFQKNNSK